LARLRLSVQFESGARPDDWPLSRPRLRRLILASLPANCAQAEITVVLMGTAKARRLNRDYRGQDHATNILTFPYTPAPHGVLHASGMDHQRKSEAEAMEWLEAAILGRFRIPNPYA